MNKITILVGNALTRLDELSERSVHCCVTSPPYYQLRDYETGYWVGGVDGCGHIINGGGTCDCGADWIDEQIGQEQEVTGYVEALCAVFDKVRRVLRDDGTLWLNIGDKYDGNGSLMGVPWMVSSALQKRGWCLRSSIIWVKQVPVPESIHTRPTASYEYIFMMSKSPKSKYYYDWWAAREIGTGGLHRNIRDVWVLATERYSGAHFAVFPPELPRRAITYGTSPMCCAECGASYQRVFKLGKAPGGSKRVNSKLKQGISMPSRDRQVDGWSASCNCGTEKTKPAMVLDPFFGAGTTGLVSGILHRDCIGTELSPAYVAMAAKRINDKGGFFYKAEVLAETDVLNIINGTVPVSISVDLGKSRGRLL